ncbi:MAG: 50S ribosomal protein L25 [Ectothiorhodospiraceae bacterium]|nr:50S ribosomal protein L25 [Ectothiorhodospiraceae bacterium]
MAEITINARIRKETGTKHANQLRREDRVPGIYYLHGEHNIAIDIARLDLRPVVYTAETNIINLKLDDGSEHQCIMKDLQFDPVTDKLIHYDLLGLVKGEKLRLEIPVVLTGTPIGIKAGGILQHVTNRVMVECLPKDIPQHIEFDVSGLEVGDSLSISDVDMPDIEFLVEADTTVATVQFPKIVEEEEPEEEGEELTEPELIGKEGDEEEGEESQEEES